MTKGNTPPVFGTASGQRQLIRVCAPSAHAGIGDALRRAFSPPPMSSMDRDLLQLLERC